MKVTHSTLGQKLPLTTVFHLIKMIMEEKKKDHGNTMLRWSFHQPGSLSDSEEQSSLFTHV